MSGEGHGVHGALERLWREAHELLGAMGGTRAARLREQAWAWFEARGLPTRRDEAWKYTRLDAWTRLELRVEPGDEQALDAAFERLAIAPDGTVFGFADGALVRVPAPLPHGVVARAWSARGLRGPDDAMFETLAAGTRPEASAIDALQAALFTDGVRVDVAPGSHLDAPLVFAHVAANPRGAVWSAPRNELVMGADATATLVELAVADDSARGEVRSAELGELRIHLGPRARLRLVHLRLGGRQTYAVHRVHAAIDAGATLDTWTVTLGAPADTDDSRHRTTPESLARHELHVRFEGEGARAALRGLQLATRTQHLDDLTHVVHAVEGCRSDQQYRGIATGRSHVVFTGTVRVCPGADRTEAHQQDANLLLSPEAEVDTRPELEIFADDVQCTHGATVGALDDDAIFYLRSRGIGEDAARALLTLGFASAVLPPAKEVPEWAVRAARGHVQQWLERTLAAPAGDASTHTGDE